jgi:NADH-quinone oxidoreductase subunit L
VFVPLARAAVLGAGVRVWGKAAAWIALPGPLLALAVGAASIGGGSRSGSIDWIVAGDSAVRLGYHVDGLAALMLLVVGVVASCVMVFSVGYMHGERGFVRYYAFLSLFTAAMAGMVMATDLVGLFLGWELVGTCSFLLIGFWYDRPSAADAARKAFLVTRVGDAAMLIGMAILWAGTNPHTLVLSEIFAKAPGLPAAVLTAAAVCVLLGAVGKSAQFPLHVWLPDAMEGPTPVSALIHAATMVAAGVFLVARTWPLFEASPAARMVALTLGTITALGAATIALPQNDIKKVLAYSTISQLGFMFAALGAGAPVVALFHLVTHAAFKALLFLAAGSVIHGTGTQDLRSMGGLWRRMPVTTVTWCVGGAALAGIWPLAGFFSKDEIVAGVLHAAPLAGVALLAASVLTGAYIARATQLAFFGASRGEKTAHESGPTMWAPLVLLAVLAAGLGAFGMQIAHLLGHEAEPLEAAVAVFAVSLGLVGIFAGWFPWARDPGVEVGFPRWFERIWLAARGGYGYDGLLVSAVVRPVVGVAIFAYAFVDRLVIDGLAEGVGRAASVAGRWFAEIQNGDGQWYAALLATGVVILLCAAIVVVG